MIVECPLADELKTTETLLQLIRNSTPDVSTSLVAAVLLVGPAKRSVPVFLCGLTLRLQLQELLVPVMSWHLLVAGALLACPGAHVMRDLLLGLANVLFVAALLQVQQALNIWALSVIAIGRFLLVDVMRTRHAMLGVALDLVLLCVTSPMAV